MGATMLRWLKTPGPKKHTHTRAEFATVEECPMCNRAKRATTAARRPRRISAETPLFDWAKFETGVAPLTNTTTGDALGTDINQVLADLDLLALPIATGTLTLGGAA